VKDALVQSSELRRSSADTERRVPRVTLRDVYRFAYFVALRSASWKRRADILRLLIEPCNYWRNIEVPAVINRLQVRPGQRVLDIGSPKLPSLFIWRWLGADVYATDLFPYFFEEYSHYADRLRGPNVNADYHIEQQDARQLRYPDNYFDRVYAISVLEHIEEEGDSKAMREIARVLKPGGLCCLTVPFADHYRESTIDREIYFKKPVDGQPVFYERHYDRESLKRRLILPSGLSLTALELYGERWFSYEHSYNRLPHLLRVALAPLGPLFSKLLLVREDLGCAPTPQMALIELHKEGPAV
jgi:ubiquinone/menaquinone biosynthesis C-methylase UbiE